MIKRQRASFTASSVARSASMGAKFQHPDILPEDYLETMLKLQRAAGILTPIHEYVASKTLAKSIAKVIEQRFLPGVTSHMPLRKRYIYDQTKSAITKGAKSVINIGAGFDALCWHLAPQYPDVKFYEIDHPLTAHTKEAALHQLGVSPDNFEIIPVDLSRVALHKVLPEIIRSEQSLFIAEGLLMYLPEKSVKNLFLDISENCLSGSLVVFTHLPLDKNNTPNIGKQKVAAISRWILNRLGEPILWGCQPEHLGDFLQAAGLKLTDHPTFSETCKRYFTDKFGYDTLEWFATGEKI